MCVCVHVCVYSCMYVHSYSAYILRDTIASIFKVGVYMLCVYVCVFIYVCTLLKCVYTQGYDS